MPDETFQKNGAPCRYCGHVEADFSHEYAGQSDHTLAKPRMRAPKFGTGAATQFWRKHFHTYVASERVEA